MVISERYICDPIVPLGRTVRRLPTSLLKASDGVPKDATNLNVRCTRDN